MRHAMLALTAAALLAGPAARADCPEDLSGDGHIDLIDLGILLAAWELDDGGDVDGDGDTDISDLGALLAVFDFDCPTQPGDMVPIPAGAFAMGDHHGVGDDDELPVHDVYVDAFHIDIYETTNRQYAAYLNHAHPADLKVVEGVVYGVSDTANDYPYLDTHEADDTSRIHFDGATFTVTADKDDHPVVFVSWYGAAAYANWRSSEEGLQPSYQLATWTCDFGADGYRLPTEAEWEYAARGGEYTSYDLFPWGDTINGSHANYWESGDPFETGPYPWTSPVGYYDGGQTPQGVDMANGYGLYDVIGNVWEWCHDWYDDEYYNWSPYLNPKGPRHGGVRVLRGGTWKYEVGYSVRSACRGRYDPDHRRDEWGFRLVRN